MALTVSSDPSRRLTLEYNLTDGVPRCQPPKFHIGDAVRLRTKREMSKIFALTFIRKFFQRIWQDTQPRSVEEHVKEVDRILRRRDAGEEFLGPTWDRFINAYKRDLEQRIWAVIVRSDPVGAIRETLIDKTLEASGAVLRAYVQKYGRKDICCGWVFFILENSLCEALQQGHQSFPDEAETLEQEDVQLSANIAFNNLPVAGDFAFETLKRIGSDPWTHQNRPIFHITGKQLKCSPKNAEQVPTGSEKNELGPDVLEPKAASRDVIVGMGEKAWEQTLEGVAASYVRWMLRDESTGRCLLGFMPRKTPSQLRKISYITICLIALLTIVIAFALASGNFSQHWKFGRTALEATHLQENVTRNWKPERAITEISDELLTEDEQSGRITPKPLANPNEGDLQDLQLLLSLKQALEKKRDQAI